MILSLGSALVTLYLELSVQFWAPQHERPGVTRESPTKGNKSDHWSGADLTQGKAGRAGSLQPGEEEPRRGEDLINANKYLKGGCRQDRARLLFVVPSPGTGGSGHKEKHRRFCPDVHNLEALFHCEGDHTLAQVAQRSCGASFLADRQKPSGHGPG